MKKYVFLPEVAELDLKYIETLADFCGWATLLYRHAHPYKVPAFKKRRASRIRNLLKKPDGGGLDIRYAPVVK